MTRYKTPEQHIQDCRQRHGDRYTYHSETVVGVREHMTVTCEDHGPWRVSPDNHKRGKGCPVCAKSVMGNSKGIVAQMWDSLPLPKLTLQQTQSKARSFGRKYGRQPNGEEVANLAKPEWYWLQQGGPSEYYDDRGRPITQRDFYDRFQFERVDYNTWTTRMVKNARRAGEPVTFDKAVSLLKTWGVADRVVGILYCWTHKSTGMQYVGITTETLKERVRGHLRTVQYDDYPESGLHAAIAADGIEAFTIVELSRHTSMEELANAERKAIATANCIAPYGYNLEDGGKGISLRALPLTFRGARYKNLTSLAEAFGIPIKRLDGRLRLGWTIDEAVDIPKRRRRINHLSLPDGTSLRALADQHGIKYATVHDRLTNYGWSLEESLGLTSRMGRGGNAKQVTVGGVEFPSNAEAAKHFGIGIGAWRKRLINGWSLEQAAGIEPRAPRTKKVTSKSSSKSQLHLFLE